jgi:hypothetical protein
MFKDMERDVREFALAVRCEEAHLLVAGPQLTRIDVFVFEQKENPAAWYCLRTMSRKVVPG